MGRFVADGMGCRKEMGRYLPHRCRTNLWRPALRLCD
jgi:hypothetical protein